MKLSISDKKLCSLDFKFLFIPLQVFQVLAKYLPVTDFFIHCNQILPDFNCYSY